MTGSRVIDHVRALDGLRFVAVALVLAAHIPMDGRHMWLVRLNEALPVHPAYIGVDIFFVLSGFLITRILLKERGRPGAYRRFITRRALRIFPIYVLTIAALAPALPLRDLLHCLTYTSNYLYAFEDAASPVRHTWSLCVEEHYYLIWPVVVLFAGLLWSRAACLATPLLAGAAMLAWQTLAPEHAEELIYRGSACRVLSLGVGSALAFFEGHIRSSPQRTLLCAAGFSALSLAVTWALEAWPGASPAFVRAYSTAFFSASIVLTAIGCDRKATMTGAALRWGPIVYLGRISYGLYLYHYVVFHFADRAFLAFGELGPLGVLATDAVKLGATLVIASASYRWIERPLLRVKGRVAASSDETGCRPTDRG